MTTNAVDIARTAVVDQLSAMFGEALSHTTQHMRQNPSQIGNPLYAYTLGVDSWRAVARRALPLSVPYASRADLCIMCTLRGLESLYRDTLTVHLRNLSTGDDEPTYNLTDALTAILSSEGHLG